MKYDIEKQLKQVMIDAVLKAFDYRIDEHFVVIEIPKDTSLGDYATNVAMRLAKPLRKNPKVIAMEIIDKLDMKLVEAVNVAGAGFINIFIKQSVLASNILRILQLQDDYGRSDMGQNQKINLEYVSANPTGDLHPGHARGAAIGDSVARIMAFAGYDVLREFYVNDAGNQIHNMAKSLQARYYLACDLDVAVPKDGYHGDDLIEIAAALQAEVKDAYLSDDLNEHVEAFKQYGLKAELDKIKADLQAFDVEFDVYSSEQALRDQGLVEAALARLQSLDMVYEADQALWLKTTLFDDDKDRVLRKSDGSYTYLLPDIAYHLDKINRGYAWMVDFLGADHHGYITRLKAAIEALQVEATLEIDIIQMARMIKDGEEFKLSKRSGKSVALKELIEIAGKDALRYYYASKASDTQMDLDLDMASKQSNENPVYYAQYAHARVCSILKVSDAYEVATQLDDLVHPKEIELMKHLNEFVYVVEDTALTRQPHKITNYIQKVAQLFHSFYGECHVLDENNKHLSSQRLALVKAVKITLANALSLIGVSAPESM